ncbi:uncharacterized protein YukE [Kitasatospora acidiphila]
MTPSRVCTGLYALAGTWKTIAENFAQHANDWVADLQAHVNGSGWTRDAADAAKANIATWEQQLKSTQQELENFHTQLCAAADDLSAGYVSKRGAEGAGPIESGARRGPPVAHARWPPGQAVVVGGDHLGDGGEVANRGGAQGGAQGLLELLAVAGQAVPGERGAHFVQGGRPGRGRALVVGLGGAPGASRWWRPPSRRAAGSTGDCCTAAGYWKQRVDGQVRSVPAGWRLAGGALSAEGWWDK